MTDGPTGIFRKSLAAVPYDQSPYSERYPHLANILEDDPGAPKYNIARLNRFDAKAVVKVDKNAEAGNSIEGSRRRTSIKKRKRKRRL